MHRSLTLFFTCAALLWSSTCFAAPGELGDSSGFNDNPHNLSSRQTGTTPHATDMPNTEIDTEICIFCHTPHGATPASTLWGRPEPGGTFSIRAGLGISDAGAGGFDDSHYGDTSGNFEYPNGSSKLCLSCHDGVTALGILNGGAEIEMVNSDLGTAINLTASHPISFIYNTAVKNHLGANYTLPDPSYLDGSSRVQCTACHQPHQDTRGTGTNLPFWRVGSGDPLTDYDPVCLECHSTGTYGLPGPKEHQY